MLKKFLLPLSLISFLITLLLSSFLPIYTDEMSLKLFQARYWLDHHRMIILSAECLSNFSRKPPLTWLPPAWINSLIFEDMTNPIKIRIAGLIGYVFWVIAFSGLVGKYFRLRIFSRILLGSAIVSLTTIGLMPFVMVTQRPEMPLLLGITFLAFVPLVYSQSRGVKSFGWVILYLLTYSTMSFFHPKALFFLPLAIVSVSSFFRKNRLALVISLVGILSIAVQTASFMKGTFSCPENPYTMERLEAGALKPQDFLLNPQGFYESGIKNFLKLDDYLAQITFRDSYQNEWTTNANGTKNSTANWLNKGIVLFYPIILLLAFLAFFVGLFNDFIKRRMSYQSLTAATMVAAVVAFGFIRTSKVYYDLTLFFPLLLIVISISVRAEYLKKFRKILLGLLAVATVFSVLNQAVLWRLYFPEARGDWSKGGTLGSLYISAFHFDIQNRKTIEAAELCGIPMGADAKHIIIDDLTYPVFWKTREPQYSLFSYMYKLYLGDVNQLLKYYDSDGIITQCTNFPATLLPIAIRKNDLCCLGKSAWR